MENTIYAKYNRMRAPKFQTCTKIIQNAQTIYVEKEALTTDAQKHIEQLPKSEEALNNIYCNVRMVPVEMHDGKARFQYVEGETASDILTVDAKDCYKTLDNLKKLTEKLFQINAEYISPFVPSDEFEKYFGSYPGLEGKDAISPCNIDMILDNFIKVDDQWYVIDYEWVTSFAVPVEFVLYRTYLYFYEKNALYFDGKINRREYFSFLGISEELAEVYRKMDDSFQTMVHGENRKYMYMDQCQKEGHNIHDYLNLNEYVDDMLNERMEVIHMHEDTIRNLQNSVSELNEKLQNHAVDLDEKINKIHEYEIHSINMQNLVDAKDQEIANLQSQNQALDNQLRRCQDILNQMLNSASWKMTEPIRKVLNVPGCIRQHGWKYTARYALTGKTTPSVTHQNNTVSVYQIDEKELEKQRNTKFKKNVKFSILVPLYNTPEIFLREMIESVQNQTYSNWELCMADGSDADHKDVARIAREYAKKDKRILYKKLEKNLGISENTNACIEMATGDYIALFDHDDWLAPSALYENMKVIDRQNADFIYSDENTFHHDPSDAFCPHFKPDFSPDTLRSYNYICHFSVFKRSLLDQVGHFRKEFDGSQDYDIILRLTEKAKTIVHIPKIIYYWRAHEASVASDISAKTYCLDAAKKALAEHLQRIGLEGKVEDSRIPSVYKIQYKINGNPKISILIPNKDHIEDLDKCIQSVLTKSTYQNFEIIIIENNSEEQATFDYYKTLEENTKIKVVTWESEFNYAAINNYGAKYATGDFILLLNNDVEIITSDWLEQMLMFAQRSDVGAVGAMLYYSDDTIQHAGVILGIGGVAGHSHKYFKRGEYGYASRLALAQNLSAVTAACMLMSKKVFHEVGGLDETFKVAFNDVDLCMKIRQKGYLIVFTPFAELYHYESKSRGLEDTKEKQQRFQGEINRFYEKWGKELKKGDPYYNPNLTLEREDFSVDADVIYM